MKVRMNRKVLSPGVEYANHSGISAQVFFIMRKTFHHTPGSIEEELIHYSRLIQAELIECLGQCKDYMKISCWKQLRFSGLYPPLTLYLLALGTMSIPAGVITDANMATRSTQIDMTAQRRRSASSDRIQCTQLPGVEMA